MTDEVPIYEVGYASGVFDLFHVGHLNILKRARAHCRVLVAGVASDEFVEAFKGVRPTIPLEERYAIVSALRIVDEVIVDRSADKRLAWMERQFDVIFKGDDWEDTPRGLRLEQDMRAVGVGVVYFPYTMTTSSTLLRSYLSGEVPAFRNPR